MNCLEFERQLDGGALEVLPAAALAHVNECARCTRALARARSLERQLERAFSAERGAPVTPGAALDAPSAGFTDRVMARVALAEARGVHRAVLADALPWWVRVAHEPSVVLAAIVSALLLWKGDALMALARAGSDAATRTLPAVAIPAGVTQWLHALSQALLPSPQADWRVVAAFMLGVAPVLALMGWLAWQLGERIAWVTAGSERG